MNPNYSGHRFPPEIISYAVWLYHRFTLSFRDVEDLLAERSITVSYESIRIGVSSLDRNTLDLCAGNRDDSVTSGVLMKCLSQSVVNAIISGVPLTRTGM